MQLYPVKRLLRVPCFTQLIYSKFIQQFISTDFGTGNHVQLNFVANNSCLLPTCSISQIPCEDIQKCGCSFRALWQPTGNFRLLGKLITEPWALFSLFLGSGCRDRLLFTLCYLIASWETVKESLSRYSLTAALLSKCSAYSNR